MIAYYIFFTGFMLASFLELKVLMKYCGFLKAVGTKTLFYVFLTSLGFASITTWQYILVGSIFALMTVLNLLRIMGCCKDKPAEGAAEGSRGGRGGGSGGGEGGAGGGGCRGGGPDGASHRHCRYYGACRDCVCHHGRRHTVRG